MGKNTKQDFNQKGQNLYSQKNIDDYYMVQFF